MSKGELKSGRLVKGSVGWPTVREFIQASQYERVAEFLSQAQAASTRKGDAVLAETLSAAYQICLASGQCRSEVERYRQACKEAGQREHELRQQLHAILDLISRHRTPNVQEKHEPSLYTPVFERFSFEHDTYVSSQHLSLRQRIKSLLTRRKKHSSEQKTPNVPDEVTTAPTAKAAPKSTASLPKRETQREQAPASLVVYCLGPFRVYQNDNLIRDWNGLKGQCIFKYFILHRYRPVAKDILMDLFWPDADPEAARRNLHQAVYSLRQTLKQGNPDFQYVQFENDCYMLNPEMALWLDSEEFERRARAGRRLEADGKLVEAITEYGVAEGLYQGDYMMEDLYEDWPSLRREHIRNLYLVISDRLSAYYIRQAEYAAAIALCQRALAQDKCCEEAYRRLMQCYLAQGQRHQAVRQYQACVQVLKEELDLTPSEETTTLYQRIVAPD
jgi:DNA-binding SARP family transcriptional activator